MWWRGPLPHLPRPHPFVDFLGSDSANRHILGCGDPSGGPTTPKFELWQDFLYNAPKTKFRHPKFNRSEVIVLTNKQTNWQTNKQTPLKTSTLLRHDTPVGNNYFALLPISPLPMNLFLDSITTLLLQFIKVLVCASVQHTAFSSAKACREFTPWYTQSSSMDNITLDIIITYEENALPAQQDVTLNVG